MHHTRDLRPAAIEQEIDRVLLDVFRKTLVSVTLGLAGLFAVFFAGHLISLSGGVRVLMAAASMAAAGASLAVWWILKYRNPEPRKSSLLGTLLAALPLVYTLVYLAASHNPYISTNLTFLLIGAGLLFVSARWYTVFAGVTLAGWLAVSYRFISHSDWMFFGFLVLAGALVGFFVQMFRIGSTRRIEKLRIEDEHRRKALRAALAEAEEARRLAEETSRALEEAVDIAQKSRERFQHLSEATFEAVMIHDRSRILDANEAMLKMFGYTLRELRTMRPAELVVPTERQVMGESLPRAPGKRFEVEALHKNRSRFTAELRGRTVSFHGEEAMVTAIRDVSGRKAVEAELIEARRRAEETAELKSSFLANVSHEIRTPMNGVVGMTTLLLDTPLSEEQQEYAQIIRTSADALLTIINDILDYSKIDAGQLELEEQAFSLRSCLEEAIDLVALQASQKGLEVAYAIDRGVPERILSDATRLRQILANLLANAVKFTHEGEIIVSVTADRMTSGAYTLQFAVRDTGIGIPEARMHRLFRSFSQVDASTTRNYGGTGLGLAICKRLSEALGGLIWAESRPGEGSTFFFTITASGTEEVDNFDERARSRLAGSAVQVYYRNAAAGALVRARLQALGMRVTLAAGFEAGGSSAEAPEIVMIDGSLIEDPARRIRDRLPESQQDAPVILVSPIGSHQQFHIGGAHVVVSKPLKHRALVEALLSARNAPAAPPFGDVDACRECTKERSAHVLLAAQNDVDLTVMTYLLQRRGCSFEQVRTGEEIPRALESGSYDFVLSDVRLLHEAGEEFRQIRESSSRLTRPHVMALVTDLSEVDGTGLWDDYLLQPVTMEALRDAIARSRTSGDGRPDEVTPFPAEVAAASGGSFAEMAARDPDFLSALRRDFAENAVEALDRLEWALEEGTEDELTETIEYLRSAIRIAQAPELDPAFERLEKGCLSGAAQAARLEIRNMRRLLDEMTSEQDCA